MPRHEGSLHDIIARLGGRRFSENSIAFVAKQLLLSLDYMHRGGYIHRNVCSHSINVRKDGTIRLGRLHHAIKRPSGARTACHVFARNVQQIPWAAPELLRQDLVGYTEKIDV
jgi:STE20-related kinase adapter protein alpha